jgi:hypothetical protein
MKYFINSTFGKSKKTQHYDSLKISTFISEVASRDDLDKQRASESLQIREHFRLLVHCSFRLRQSYTLKLLAGRKLPERDGKVAHAS